MLRVRNLRSGYGSTPVLMGVDLDIREGEIVALLGRNGVGKSTLLKTIVGLVRARQGSVELEGRAIGSLRPHRRARLGLAYVPQGRGIFPHLTVRDNIRVAAMGTGGRHVQERAEEALEAFPMLKPKLRERGETLSGGQQQILALARALAAAPRVMLLDEPSEGIQPSIVAQIAERIHAMNAERSITVLLVEQNLDFAAQLASRALVMRKGQIAQEAPMDRIAHDIDIQREYIGV
jgi:urea ABC transporter ATP-binding protein UrtE